MERQSVAAVDTSGLAEEKEGAPRRLTAVAAPLRRQVVEVLRESIATLDFKPGQRLIERDLCDRLGVSRTVIREALRHLEAEGLVNIIPNHGPVVSTTTLDEARQLYEAREAIESYIARYCAIRADDTTLARLSASVKAVEAAHATSDLVAQLRAKDELYAVMAAGAGNAVMGALIPVFQVRVRLIEGLSAFIFEQHAKSVEEIRAIVAAIQERDGDKAASLAIKYVRAGAKVLENFATTRR